VSERKRRQRSALWNTKDDRFHYQEETLPLRLHYDALPIAKEKAH